MSTTLQLTFQPYSGTTFTIEVNVAAADFVQTLNIGSQSTGAGAGRVTFNPFSFTRKPDTHSPEFWAKMCSGTPYLKVTLADIGDGAKTPFFTFVMGLVAIKTMSFAASESDGSLVETILMEYGQAGYIVTPQNPDGSLGTPVSAGWDRVKNVLIDPATIGGIQRIPVTPLTKPV